MSEQVPHQGNRRRTDWWLALLPAAGQLAMEAYVSGFDGWGKWGAAPLLLVPAILGFGISVGFLAQGVNAYRGGNATARFVLLAVLSLTSVLWLCVRRFLI